MTYRHLEALLPTYKGLEWQDLELPRQVCPWPVQIASDLALDHLEERDQIREHSPVCEDNWQWPKNDIVVFTDLHADGDAFVSSLVASGYITKHGPEDSDFILTKRGKKCRFVINGDCFDKGPSNLRLLQLIHQLMNQKAKLKIIAGNHDIRFAIGMRSLKNRSNPLLSHLFIRMAPKGASFFKEIYDDYIIHMPLKKRVKLGETLSDNEVRQRLYPNADWENLFRKAAKGLIKDSKIEKEIDGVHKKQIRFEGRCKELGMTLPMAYAAINYWQDLFLSSKGEFSWFFKKMKLMYANGSFLFMHAGIDDVMAKRLIKKGVDGLNKKFHKELKQDPFNLYYGPMGNIFRTKYRENDHDFTREGANILTNCGYKAIVQGHCNRHQGQELVVRYGLLNFECDASLDIQTRIKEGLVGKGAATTLIKKSGVILGISVDYPFVKAYLPDAELATQRLQ